MNRNAHRPAPRGRRFALGCGTAAGAAVIAASISMGTAPVAGADTSESDVASYLIGAVEAHALSAAGVPESDAVSYFIEALDPEAFSSSGAPTDALGLLGYGLDTYLLGPTGLDAVLEPYVVDLVGTVTVGSPPTYTDAVSELIMAFDPNAFSATGAPTDALGLLGYGLDMYLLGPSGIDNLLAPLVADFLASLPSGAASVLDADPVSDVIGALDPSALSSLGLPDGVLGGALLDPVVDGLLGSGLSLF